MRRRVGAVLTSVLATVAALGAGSAGADTPDPAPWPQVPGVDPGIDATAHSLRIAGPERSQTALSSALLTRGAGTYPFGTSDRTSGAGADLATAGQWWGLGTCPFAVIVTAGDTPADSLAAASLSDPTDGSTEPFLARTASADPFLAPVGAMSRVDTDSAPIVVTASARQGASVLSAPAFTAIADLADGACRSVDAAIVVGGPGAVPSGVDQQLLGLGVSEVFRIAGADRYATAAAIARALGTGQAPAPGTACADDDVTDGDAEMGFHGNAAVEVHHTPTRCTVRGRTVVLTDGVTGADALAAGWWTSTWQVPVLLVDGAGRLPPPTLAALGSMVVDNVVVLGGRARVPDTTVVEVQQLTGAEALRVSGADRYETSVRMAETFGGWFPTGDGADHDGSMVCLAASSGSGADAVGWPDALGAGPWCARAGGIASGISAPVRALPPTAGFTPRTSRGGEPSHDAVPVLLTPATSPTLAPPVAELLAGAFDPADTWCSSVQALDACLDPGFAFAFGGTSVLSDDAVLGVARAVSGQTYVSFDDQQPSSAGGFWTELDLAPVYGRGGVPGDVAVGSVCIDRGAVAGVRWLSAYADLPTSRFLADHDVFSVGGYITPGSPGENGPTCLAVPPADSVNALGTSLSGHTTTVGVFAAGTGAGRRFALSQPIVQRGAESFAGTDATVDGADGTTTRLTFSDRDLDGVVATSGAEPAAVEAATIEVTIERGFSDLAADRFTASLSLATSLGDVTATAGGEAVRDGTTWHLRGRSSLPPGSWYLGGTGGFSADLFADQPDPTDDQLTWSIDAFAATPAS